jgi:trehalose 6-phosphate phosphatase
LREAGAALEAFAARDARLIFEQKGVGVTLHYRQAPEFEQAADALARRLAEETGLAFQPGDCIVELRTPGFDKGDAVRQFMAEPPFAGALPVFVGDDLTDENGFAAAEDLGGFGVLVGADRPTRATARLSGPAEVFAWLENRLSLKARA